jgi:acid phosphatase type 7
MQKFILSGSICVIAAFLPLYGESPSGIESGPNKIKSDSTTISTTADPVLVGAGDIASCDDLSGAKATAELLEQIPGTIFANGDLAYPAGTDRQFHDCYGPTWGRFKARTRPTPGNHEFQSSGASGYSRYWGAVAGDPDKDYYSYDIGTWHIIALNSACAAVGGCDAESAQGKWLRHDLAQHPGACTLAYFHKPLFSSGKEHGYDPQMKPLWQMLYAGGADIIIGGHDHHYERFAPQDPDGNPDPRHGIREFVVGTGGKNSHRSLGPTVANSEVRNADTFGVLKLTLHARSYDWKFVPQAGKSFTDAGSDVCR